MIIEPEFPKPHPSTDSTLPLPPTPDGSMDTGVQDTAVVDSATTDMETTVDMEDGAQPMRMDAFVPAPVDMGMDISVPQRPCTNWSECLSGEVCISSDGNDDPEAFMGFCEPASADVCPEPFINDDGELPPREFIDQCCLPEDGAARGLCLLPYAVESGSIDMQTSVILERPWESRRQFSTEACFEDASEGSDVDLIFRGEIPAMSTIGLCAVLNLEASPNMFGSGAEDLLTGLTIEAFSLTSCCNQTQAWDANACSLPNPLNRLSAYLDLTPTDTGMVMFGLRLKFAHGSGWELIESTTAILGGDLLALRYRIRDTRCCRDNSDCPEDSTCENGLCE